MFLITTGQWCSLCNLPCASHVQKGVVVETVQLFHRGCLCQLEQEDMSATAFCAPHRARKGEGVKKGFHGWRHGFLSLSPTLETQ